MKTNIVRIGNSRGLRLPKALLAQCSLDDEVELMVEDGRLVICATHAPRAGWNEAFAAMADQDDDALLDRDGDRTTGWEKTEWRW